MSVVNNVLKSVPRNSDGFEDVDSFWNTSEKLVFPVAELPRLFSSAKPTTTPSKSTPQKVDSDIEFNYDTSPDISDEEEDNDEEEESESDNDKDDHDDIPSPDGASTKTGRSKSILSSGAKSSRSSIQSSVYSPLNASLQSVGVSPLGTTNGSIRQSLESGIDGSDISGRESILSRGTGTPTTSAGSTRTSINPGSSSKKSVANTTNNSTISTSNNTSVNASSHNTSRNSSVDTSIDNSANTTNNTSHNTSHNASTNASTNTSVNNSRRASESGLDLMSPAGRSLNESSFFADRSGDMNETGAVSEFGFGQKPPTSVAKGRRASTNSDSLATPGSAAKPSTTPAASASASGLQSATKGARSGDRAGLRVSFGNQSELADLSPIEASGLGSVDTGASKRSQSRNSSHNTSLNASLDLSPADSSIATSANSKNTSRNTSRNTTKNTTINSSRNTSRNTTATSVRSSGSAEASSLQQSREEEEDEQDRDNDSFGDYANNDYDEPEEFDRDEEQGEGEEDEPSRLASQTDTPTTNRSFSRSGMGLNDSELRSPYSEANTSSTSRGSARTPGSGRRGERGGGTMSMISTPGSNEFVRGYHMPDPDATVMNELSTDEEDDEDLDETGVSTPEVGGRKRGGKQGGKKNTVTDGEDELNTTNPNEVTTTFIDVDYLHTIGSSNKKYVKAREELKKRRPKVSKPRRTQLYHSSDEEDGGARRGSSEEEEEEQDSEEEGGRRRSKRATKGQRFQFWKGERPIYEKGTLVEIHAPDPTPQKRKRPTAKVTEDGKAAKRAKKATRADHSDDEEEHEHAVAHKLPPVRVPKNVKYLARDDIETLEIWDEVQETQGAEKVFCTAESLLPPVALPRTAKRQPGRDKVGFAAHSFNVQEVPNTMSGWLSGFIDLPPDAIKDAEGVGRFTQVFFVSDCQDGALELGLANPSQDEWVDRTAQRVLLKKGDCFYVPPGNIYRLENHSTVKSSKLNWVIIKPLEQNNNLDDGEADEGSVVSGASLGESPNTTGALLDGRAGRRAPISVEEDM